MKPQFQYSIVYGLLNIETTECWNHLCGQFKNRFQIFTKETECSETTFEWQ